MTTATDITTMKTAIAAVEDAATAKTALEAVSDVIDDFDTSIGALDTTVDAHTTSISALDTTVGNLDTTVGAHTTTLSGHTTSISALDTTVGAHTTTLSSHTSSLTSHDTTLSSHTSTLSSHTSSLSSHNTRLTALEAAQSLDETDINDLLLRRMDNATNIKPASPLEDGSEVEANLPSSDPNALVSLPASTHGAVYAVVAFTTGATLNAGAVDRSYTKSLVATGGVSGDTLSFTLDARTPLPAGLVLASNGVISGTPTIVGTSSFIVTVADESGNSVSRRFSLTIAA